MPSFWSKFWNCGWSGLEELVRRNQWRCCGHEHRNGMDQWEVLARRNQLGGCVHELWNKMDTRSWLEGTSEGVVDMSITMGWIAGAGLKEPVKLWTWALKWDRYEELGTRNQWRCCGHQFRNEMDFRSWLEGTSNGIVDMCFTITWIILLSNLQYET